MRTQRETSWAQIGQISRILSARDVPMSDPMRSEACPIRGSERSGAGVSLFFRPQRVPNPLPIWPRQRGVSFHPEKDRGSQAKGRTCLEGGRRSATAVIASEAGWREVDLPVLWQRRSRSVVQEEAGRALPRLL